MADIVGGLDEKAVEAEVRGLNLCVLSASDYKQLEEEDPPFSTVPKGSAREYAKTIIRGAETMLDLIDIVIPGAYYRPLGYSMSYGVKGADSSFPCTMMINSQDSR